MFDANFPKQLWAEAINTAAYLCNRSVVTGLENKTPYEMWDDKKPDVSNIRIFGSEVMAHIPKEKRRKFDKKAQKMFLVDYGVNVKGYRLFDPVKRDVITSDVVINEKISLSENVTFNDRSISSEEFTDAMEESLVSVRDNDKNSFLENLAESESFVDPDDNEDLDFTPENVEIPSTSRKSNRDRKPTKFDEYVTFHCKKTESPTHAVFKLSGGVISCKSRKQNTVALSSTEAEYMAISNASKEAIYLRNLINEIDGGLDWTLVRSQSRNCLIYCMNTEIVLRLPLMK